MKIAVSKFLIFFIPFLLVSAEDSKPNIVLILTDDMGYADLAEFGDSEIATPNIDQLCADGVKLTNAYVSAPICVPSRMGLLSGKYQQRFGVYNNVYSLEENKIWFQQITIADVLKRAGYHTGLVGKWHLSGNSLDEFTNEHEPHTRGFDEFVGITGGMADFWPGTNLVRYQDEQYKPFPAPEYLTEFFGKEAVAFIERNKDHPFFLYLAFNAPHAPLHALDKDQAPIDVDWISPDRRIYNAMVRAVDRNVGRVLKALKQSNLNQNTLIIFLNDNGGGGNNAAPHTRNTARNVPFRGHKFDVLEGGIHVPMIVSWPGQLPRGNVFSGLSSSMDIFPTAVAAAGIHIPPNLQLDGLNLLPYLKGQRSGDPHDFLCWQQLHWSRPNERAAPAPDLHQFALRSGSWKALKLDQMPEGSKNRSWELYDLSRDPGELQDVSTEYPLIIEKLASHFIQWQAEMHPLIPKS